MTKEQFLTNFYLTFNITERNREELVIISQAIRRNNRIVIDSVKTTVDIPNTNDWIDDSNTPASITPWDWNMFVDQVRRLQLDYFVQRAHITNYYPLNQEENPDVSDMYQ